MTLASNNTDSSEALRVLFDRLALGLRTAIPAVVVAVDPQGRTVDVQPAVSLVHRLDGQAQELVLPVVRGVPLQVLGSKTRGLFVAVPVSVGDDGMLVVADRALDNWQHGSGVGMPPEAQTPRHHDLTDATFYPGVQRMDGAIPSYPTDTVQVRNRAGTCLVEVSATKVHAHTPDGSDVLMQAGVIIMTVPGGAMLSMTGDTVTITGKLVVTTSVASPSILANGKQLTNHIHGGVTVGGASTAPNT